MRVIAPVVVLVVLSCTLAGSSPEPSARPCAPADRSVARLWNEAALDAVRRDFPAPTVHARNLFHTSVAMWDAWAAFEPSAEAYLSSPRMPADADRQRAVSFAAHTVLTQRYRVAMGAGESLAQFDRLLVELCLDPENPDPLGVEIGRAVLDATIDDGANEAELYVAEYQVANEPLAVAEPGTEMRDPNRWQQLEFVMATTQNGQQLDSNVQDYVGPHWGSVTPFALDPAPDGLPLDPGPPPLLGTASDEAFRAAARAVVRASSRLDPGDGETLDTGPGARGNNTLGANDGRGRPTNPMTGEPYRPNTVPAADYYRAIAEFWADGPDSETPPGHWNTLGNQVSDAIEDHRVAGRGEPVDRLEWDVTLYFALNGALHDAAVAAWGAKAHYDYARPISMIRYLGGRGLLPAEEGLVEIVTRESAAPGQRHEALAGHIGETAILAWAPEPGDSGEDLAPVRWIRAVEWLPYQRRTFVTPAFPGYVSGHSTFSRAAAEVLTAITGSAYFPGGLGTQVVEGLEFDDGPTAPVELQWASYYDAADEAGLSRLYGGIHVEADDLAGRVMGAEVGQRAWQKARTYLPER